MARKNIDIKVGLLKKGILINNVHDKVIKGSDKYDESTSFKPTQLTHNEPFIEEIPGSELFYKHSYTGNDKKFGKEINVFNAVSSDLEISKSYEGISVAFFKEVDVKISKGTEKRVLFFSIGDTRSIVDDNLFEQNIGFKTIINYLYDSGIEYDIVALSENERGTSNKTHKEKGIPVKTLKAMNFDLYTSSLNKLVIRTKLLSQSDQLVHLGKFVNTTMQSSKEDFVKLIKIFINHANKTTYSEKGFKVLDDVCLVEDEELIDELNKIIFTKLLENNFDDISLYWPKIIYADESDFKHFRIHKKHNRNTEKELVATFLSQDLLEEIKNIIIVNEQFTEDWLRKVSITFVKENDQCATSRDLFDVLFTEVKHNDKSYILQEGEWKEVGDTLVEKIKSFSDLMNGDNIKYTNSEVASLVWNFSVDADEEAFNKRIVSEVGGELLDRKLIDILDYGKLELGDVLIKSSENDILAVKYLKSSQSVSHLVGQVKNAKQVIIDSPKLVTDGLKQYGLSLDWDHPINIVVVIVSADKKSWDKLQLFSKLFLSDLFKNSENSKVNFKACLLQAKNYELRATLKINQKTIKN